MAAGGYALYVGYFSEKEEEVAAVGQVHRLSLQKSKRLSRQYSQ